MQKADLDWGKLGFSYMKTDYRYISVWKDGAWDAGKLVTENTLTISEGSTALHYGQQCFEGLKAYSTKDGRILLFRPDQNSVRMNRSCRRVLMPEVPTEKFIDACIQVVKANERFVPPHGSGATLYLRPFVIGVGDNIGVKEAPEYIFGVFCIPVGPYFKGGMAPVNFMISDYDRAAPNGTGAAKVGGNYAGSLMPHKLAVSRGFADCIYLDPETHTKIEEVGAANFFGITHDNVFVTPKSPPFCPASRSIRSSMWPRNTWAWRWRSGMCPSAASVISRRRAPAAPQRSSPPSAESSMKASSTCSTVKQRWAL